MNLPNFINFAPFNRLRERMGTNKLGEFSHEGRNGRPTTGQTLRRNPLPPPSRVPRVAATVDRTVEPRTPRPRPDNSAGR